MKRSILLYSTVIFFLVIVMIVGGVIQDGRVRKGQVKECASSIMISTGCKDANASYDLKDRKNVKTNNKDTDASVLGASLLTGDLDIDSAEAFEIIGQSLLSDAYYEIGSVEMIDQNHANVTVTVYFDGCETELKMELVKKNGEWELDNSREIINSLTR